MKKILLVCLLLVMAPSLAMAGKSPIGKIKNLTGAVIMARDGQDLSLNVGEPLYQNDRLRTGADGTLGIIFEDNTVLSLGPNTELVIDEYVFAPEKGALSMFIRMIKGTASYLSGIIGQQAPEAVKFELPDATIAIRGTHFLVKVEEEKPRLAYNWSGFYAGGFAGYSWMKLKYHEPDWPGWPGADRNPTLDGCVGGLFLGYNRQIKNMVFGIETDGGGGDLSENAHPGSMNSYSSFEIDWNTRVRAKVGVAFDKTLLFLASGLALAKVTVDDTDPMWGKDDAVHLGWTIGAGIEHALTKNLLMRLEYLYDDYGHEDYAITGPYTYKAKVDLDASTVRVGLSWHF